MLQQQNNNINTEKQINDNVLENISSENYKKLLEEKQRVLEKKLSDLVSKSNYVSNIRPKNTVLTTQIVKDLRSFESTILKMSGKWKKTYKYNICDGLVKDVISLRSNIIDALSLDKNDVEGKMYYYNLALMCFNNIEYALDLLYIELSVITVEEMVIYAIQFDKVKCAVTCLINSLKNKEQNK